MFNLLQPHAHIISKLVLDGKSYEIEQFSIKLHQPTDYKNQPQHEIKGGQLFITVTQAADDNIYMWAKKSTQLKDGVVLFQTDLGMTVFNIKFSNAYCVNLSRSISSSMGTKSSLIISPEQIWINGEEHNNFWT